MPKKKVHSCGIYKLLYLKARGPWTVGQLRFRKTLASCWTVWHVMSWKSSTCWLVFHPGVWSRVLRNTCSTGANENTLLTVRLYILMSVTVSFTVIKRRVTAAVWTCSLVTWVDFFFSYKAFKLNKLQEGYVNCYTHTTKCSQHWQFSKLHSYIYICRYIYVYKKTIHINMDAKQISTRVYWTTVSFNSFASIKIA